VLVNVYEFDNPASVLIAQPDLRNIPRVYHKWDDKRRKHSRSSLNAQIVNNRYRVLPAAALMRFYPLSEEEGDG